MAPPKASASHIQALVLVPGTLFLIQFPAKAHGKEVNDGPSTWALPPLEDTQVEFWASAWPSLAHQSHLGCEPVNRKLVSLTLPPVTWPIK